MPLLKLVLELPNLFKKFQSVLKIWTKCRLNFHEMECTGGRGSFKIGSLRGKGGGKVLDANG